MIADHDVDRAAVVAEEAAVFGHASVAVQLDVRDVSQVEHMISVAFERLDTVDILVNNAGVLSNFHLLDLDEAEWDRVLDTNLKGLFLATQRIARRWIERKQTGRIINISSIGDSRAKARTAHYAAAKGGVRMFTRAAAVDLAPHGITVNAIAPGAVLTSMVSERSGNDEAVAKTASVIPLGRLAEPSDIAAVALFLTSEAANYLTGATIVVDGGLSILLPSPPP